MDINSTNRTCRFHSLNLYNEPISAFYFAHIGPLIWVIGIGSNVLNILVLVKMKLRCAWFLGNMALADIIFCLLCFPTFSNVYAVFYESEPFNKWFTQSQITMSVLNRWVSVVSIWSGVLVTIERLQAVMQPLKVQLFWTRTKIAVTLVAVWTLCLLFNLFEYGNYKYKIGVDCNPNVTIHALQQVPKVKGWNFRYISSAIAPHVNVLVPFLLMLVLNIRLIYHLHADNGRTIRRHYAATPTSSNGDRTADKGRSAERKIAVMTAIMVVCYLVFTVPSAVLQAAMLFYPEIQKRKCRNTGIETTDMCWRIIAHIINSIVSVSKTVNFPIYCLSSKHFRTNLCQLLRRSGNNGRRTFGLSSFTSTLVSSVRSLSSRRTKYNSVSTSDGGQMVIKRQKEKMKAKIDASSSDKSEM